MGSYMGKEREKSMGMSSIGKEYITELGTESPSRLYHPVLPGVHGERGGGVTMVYQVRTLGHTRVALREKKWVALLWVVGLILYHHIQPRYVVAFLIPKNTCKGPVVWSNSTIPHKNALTLKIKLLVIVLGSR